MCGCKLAPLPATAVPVGLGGRVACAVPPGARVGLAAGGLAELEVMLSHAARAMPIAHSTQNRAARPLENIQLMQYTTSFAPNQSINRQLGQPIVGTLAGNINLGVSYVKFG